MYVPFSIVAGSFMWFLAHFCMSLKCPGSFFVVSTPKSLECLNFLSSCFTENLIERLSIKTPVSTGVTHTTPSRHGLDGHGLNYPSCAARTRHTHHAGCIQPELTKGSLQHFRAHPPTCRAPQARRCRPKEHDAQVVGLPPTPFFIPWINGSHLLLWGGRIPRARIQPRIGHIGQQAGGFWVCAETAGAHPSWH